MDTDSIVIYLSIVFIAGGLALGLVVFGGVSVGEFSSQPVLVVETLDGTELETIPVEPGTEVSIEYMHSVEKTEVRDVYEVREDGLEMTYMEFSSFGAGLPARADVEWTDNNTFIYRVRDTEPDSLIVSPGEVAGHELVVNGTRYDMVNLSDGESVRLRITEQTHPFKIYEENQEPD